MRYPGYTVVLLTLLVGPLLLVEESHANGLFRGPVPIPLPAPTFAMDINDFDGDGWPDLAVTHDRTNQVSVLFGREGLRLEPGETYDTGASPLFVVSGDLDASGLPDLFVANSGSSSATVLLNEGAGTFRLAGELRLGSGPRVAELADFDEDGRLDVVTSNLNSDDFEVLLGDGRGGFQSTGRVRVGDNPHSLAVQDFDLDGAADVAVIHSDGQSAVSLFAGRGDGTFAPGVRTNFDAADPRMLAGGDFDEDGAPDLAVLTDGAELLLLENPGDRTFHPRLIDPDAGFAGGSFVLAPFVIAEDFDADGHLDLVTKTATGGEFGIRFFAGDGRGHFTRTSDWPIDDSMVSMRFVDLDRDGILDALVTRRSAEVAIVRGIGPGELDVRKALVSLPNHRPVDLDLQDANGDGLKDLVVLSPRAYHVFVSTNGVGGFGLPDSYELPGLMQDLASGDFDGDGHMDLAFCDVVFSQVVITSLSAQGEETRLQRDTFENPQKLAAADFDGDGTTDLAVTHVVDSRVCVVLSPGVDGESRSFALEAGTSQSAVEAADADGDSRYDLLVSARDGLRVFLGDGGASFRMAREYPELADSTELRVADLDRDGQQDVIAISGNRVLVVYGALAKRGGDIEEHHLDFEWHDLRVVDIDFDGELDLGLLSRTANRLAAWRRPGRGRAPLLEHYTVGLDVRTVRFADIDGDGALDALTADAAARRVSVLYGRSDVRPESFRRGDADGNGRANVSDAVVLLVRLFRGGAPLGCPDAADADDDGALTLSDAIWILSYLFSRGVPPGPPGPQECGADPSPDFLPPCATVCR
jgi:hypothetical protein